jgi:hypothetical protein
MISSLDDPRVRGRSRHRMPIFSAPDKAHSLESTLVVFAARAAASRAKSDEMESAPVSRAEELAPVAVNEIARKDLYLWGSDRGSILESINRGRRGGMPAFDGLLKPEQLKAVSVFVLSRAGK